MNQDFNVQGDPNYIPNQSTYQPYTDFPNTNFQPSGFQGLPVNQGVSSNIQNNPQYAERIFKQNIGRRVTVYFSFPDSIEWRDKAFTGTILDDGRDYLLLQDDDGRTWLLWLIYINYAVFEGDINY